jgi:hypothetical protein
MIVIYPKISVKKLKKDAKDLIPKIEQWFKDNPKRRVCRTELWYGKCINIRRKTVAEQINAVVKELLKR